MLKKIPAFLLALLLLPCGWAAAQDSGEITGTVTDANTGSPLPGVNVVLEGTQRGSATDAQGEYRIQDVEPGAYTLQATFIGYAPASQPVEVSAGEVVQENIAMESSALELDAVAVTALGFRENRERLGAAQSSVSGDEIAESGEVSAIKGLSAKATGLNITGAGGDPGAGARIIIRGEKTIQGSNQPLVVIDGVPVSNETLGAGTDGVQQQSRLNDLNPNDIASVEVLKSASAAALWGSRAQNGVIVIETKKGGYEQRTNVSFKTSIAGSQLNKTQDLQEEYGHGFFESYEFGSTGFSWGDYIPNREGGEDIFVTEPGQYFGAIDSETGEVVPSSDLYEGVAVGRQTGRRYYAVPDGGAYDAEGNPLGPHGGARSRQTFDHGADLFEPGLVLENNLSVSGGGEDGRYYLSIGNTRQEGIIPENSDYQRTSVRLNADRTISSQFGVSALANYVRTNSNRTQQGSNISGLLLGSYRTAPDFDNTDYYVDYFPQGLDGPSQQGLQRAYRAPLGAAGPIYNNPLFAVNEVPNTSLLDRFLGKVEGSYDPVEWLNLTARTGLDVYRDRRRVFFPIYDASFSNGQQEEEEYNEYRINVDVIGRAQRELTSDIGGSALLGFSFSHREFDNLLGSVINYANPIELRSLSNSTAENIDSFTDQEVQRTAGFFGELNFDLYDQLFLKFTGRFDQASTFGPEADNTFFYPSAQLAWTFTELLPESDVLSFGKLRTNYAQVGREPNPYQAFTYFSSGTYSDGYLAFPVALSASGFGGGFERNNRLGNPFIVPEDTREFEVGTDLRFLSDRLSFSATYYNNTSNDVIFPVDVAPSTGFAERTNNAAEINNEGVELQLDAQWLATGAFEWTTNFRWWTNNNTVENIAGVRQVGLGGFTSLTSSLIEGQPFGAFYGNRWRRARAGCDTENDITESCEPLSEDEVADGFTVAEDGRVINALGFPVSAATQGVVGDPTPDWRAGIGNTFRYEGLSLDVLFDFKVGGDVWNGTKGALFFFGRHADQTWRNTITQEQGETLPISYYSAAADADENGFLTIAEMVDSGFYPETLRNEDGSYTIRGYVDDFGNGEVVVDGTYFWNGPGSGFTGPSEPFVEDGSFVRLREVTLGYDWRSGLVERAGLSSVNFSLTGTNLLLFTDYSGIDPETNLTGPSNAQGLDYFNNPSTRQYRFTVRFNY